MWHIIFIITAVIAVWFFLGLFHALKEGFKEKNYNSFWGCLIIAVVCALISWGSFSLYEKQKPMNDSKEAYIAAVQEMQNLEYEKALEHAKIVIKEDKENYSKAKEIKKTATQQLAQYNLQNAINAHSQGDFDFAREALKKSLSYSPNSKEAQELLAQYENEYKGYINSLKKMLQEMGMEQIVSTSLNASVINLTVAYLTLQSLEGGKELNEEKKANIENLINGNNAAVRMFNNKDFDKLVVDKKYLLIGQKIYNAVDPSVNNLKQALAQEDVASMYQSVTEINDTYKSMGINTGI